MHTTVLQEASEILSRARDLIKTVKENPAKIGGDDGERAEVDKLNEAIEHLQSAELAIGDYDKQFNPPGTPAKE